MLEDLRAYWPKLRAGGVMAGHDYTEQRDIDASESPESSRQDWTLGRNGYREKAGRSVQGAVEDFFGGLDQSSPDELQRCPAQLVFAMRGVVVKPLLGGDENM